MELIYLVRPILFIILGGAGDITGRSVAKITKKKDKNDNT